MFAKCPHAKNNEKNTMENPKIKKNDPSKSISGWAKVEYVSAKSVTNYTTFGGVAQVALEEDAGWATIEAGTVRQRCVQTNVHSYDHSVVMLVSCRGNDYNTDFDRMANDRYLLRMTDNAGDMWMAGCPDEPLRLTVQETDEDNPADGAAHELTFTCQSRLPLLKTL